MTTSWFYQVKHYMYWTRVISKHRNAAFAEALWGKDPEGRTWEFMYFLQPPVPLQCPVQQTADVLSPMVSRVPRLTGYKALFRNTDRLRSLLKRVWRGQKHIFCCARMRDRGGQTEKASSISTTKVAAVTKRPDKVIGMHFFNPVPVMKLVELIRGLATSDETFATVKALTEKLEKTPVEVNDAPGFVSNRVLMPLLNEAMYAVMEGVATAEAVDEVFKLGMAHPMGPLTLADFIGLDVCLDIMRVMQSGLGDPKYRPCPLLIKMVDAGWLGRKSGRGFYQY